MSELAELLDNLTEAEADVKRAEADYSVCILTGARCRDEQVAYRRATRRLHDIRKRIEKARRRVAYGD